MKITGVLVEFSETYRKHVVFKNGNKLIYVVVLREVYGMFVPELLFYKKVLEDWKILGFISILITHMSLTG